MARLALLTVAMMMVASASAQATCDMTAFSNVMAKVGQDCNAQTKCSSACQGDINEILNTATIKACFSDDQSSLQALEQFKSECGSSSASAVGVAAVSVAAAAALLL